MRTDWRTFKKDPLAGDDPARPFLKWAGGKAQLLPDLLARVPKKFTAYHEPFIGGGALFFALTAGDRLRGGASLSDVNANLVEVWVAIRDDVEAVIAALAPRVNTEEHFYAVRALDPGALTLAERAARILYLNKTGFNGLYRENSSGRFNVPFGRYANPNLCDAVNLRAVARALAGVSIEPRDFRSVLERAEPGDFVYFDPPYVPVSATSYFTAYSRGGGFGPAEQTALRDVFAQLAGRGVHVLLSNSDVPFVRELYAGFRIETVWARRNINSNPDARGAVAEVLVRAGDGGPFRPPR
jgi:DNA adenine methylase